MQQKWGGSGVSDTLNIGAGARFVTPAWEGFSPRRCCVWKGFVGWLARFLTSQHSLRVIQLLHFLTELQSCDKLRFQRSAEVLSCPNGRPEDFQSCTYAGDLAQSGEWRRVSKTEQFALPLVEQQPNCMELHLQFRQEKLKCFEAPRNHSIIKVPNVDAGSVLVLQLGNDPLNTHRKEEGAQGITLLRHLWRRQGWYP